MSGQLGHHCTETTSIEADEASVCSCPCGCLPISRHRYANSLCLLKLQDKSSWIFIKFKVHSSEVANANRSPTSGVANARASFATRQHCAPTGDLSESQGFDMMFVGTNFFRFNCSSNIWSLNFYINI